MAKRTDAEILTDFDSYIDTDPIALPHTRQTFRDRLHVEVLLDTRDYVKDCKANLDDCKVLLQDIKELLQVP